MIYPPKDMKRKQSGEGRAKGPEREVYAEARGKCREGL